MSLSKSKCNEFDTHDGRYVAVKTHFRGDFQKYSMYLTANDKSSHSHVLTCHPVTTYNHPAHYRFRKVILCHITVYEIYVGHFAIFLDAYAWRLAILMIK